MWSEFSAFIWTKDNKTLFIAFVRNDGPSDSRVFHNLQVRGKKLHHFTGSYKKFLDQRKERDAQLTAQAQAQADEIARLQVFVDRFGAKVGVLCNKSQ